MTVFAPDYYNNFKCIADKCRHNCCIGWEIDIDDDTLKTYRKIQGDIGKRLSSCISADSTPHFILDKDERCPFLNKNNLCDIITELGENKLCSICADHPRFRNFYSSSTETGIGLCCEAAAKLILSQTEKIEIVHISGEKSAEFTDEEHVFFNLRTQIFEIIQNRTSPILDRVQEIFDTYNISMPPKTIHEWADIFLSLERLDVSWTDVLNELKIIAPSSVSAEFDIVFEQLLIYFFYRHLPDALWDNMFKERILFAIVSFYMIYALCSVYKTKNGNLNFDDICEISRMYSSEIEYNEENIAFLLEILSD